jgi:hypothetical protein
MGNGLLFMLPVWLPGIIPSPTLEKIEMDDLVVLKEPGQKCSI